MKWKVVYEIEGFGKQETPPYDTFQIAEKQRADIIGFEGVYGASIEPVEEEN